MSTHTDIRHFDLVVSTLSNAAKQHLPPIEDILQVISGFHQHPSAVQEYKRGRMSCVVSEVTIDPQNDHAILLIHMADQDLPDSVYANHAKGVRKRNTKRTGEGGEVSCHVCISLKENNANSYRCLIEKTRGLPSSRVSSILNGTFKSALRLSNRNFDYPDPSGRRNKETGKIHRKTFVPTIKLFGEPSRDFHKQIKNGKLTHLGLTELVSRQFAGQQWLDEKKVETKVVITSPLISSKHA